jgi:non-lysosomal glucosylceramidase
MAFRGLVAARMRNLPFFLNEANSMQNEEISRRGFLAAGAGSWALTVLDTCCSTAAPAIKSGTHHIPADKDLHPAWVEALFAKGHPKTYLGDELTCIGMPVGGICAGQLYLRGDGTLAEWGIFNVDRFTGFGDTSYRTYTPPSPVQQGFGIAVTPKGGPTRYRTLDKQGFQHIEFSGEYPIGNVHYRADKEIWPLDVSLEAFSPFIPPNARDSAIPGTILRYRVTNVSDKPVDVAFGGWIQNPVGQRHAGRYTAVRQNRAVHESGLASLAMSIRERERPANAQTREPEVFADFESGSYGNWEKTGTAFGPKPAHGTLPNQQRVSGFGGKGLVNTFFGGDQGTGTLTSPTFTIHRPYIQFRIGGGDHAGITCINLLCDGKVIRTAAGKNNERLEWDFWEVSDHLGCAATIEIVDQSTEGWGHINIDDIRFADAPPKDMHLAPLDQQPDFGTLALSVLDEAATVYPAHFEEFRKHGKPPADGQRDSSEFPLGESNPDAGMLTRFSLEPGAFREVVFLLTWHFAGGEHGRMYGNWFDSALGVARYLQSNLDRLTTQTRLFRETYFDSTLPNWLLARLIKPISTLATNTVQWRKNGRFWAWEGVGCCDGTCTHVWNYAQGMARLFHELERSARVMQDLGVGFDPKTGRVGFRGENPTQPYAADGQCGTVLKCYREHLMSKDGSFLKEHWPRIKQVMEYEIGRDRNDDGVIEDDQWNTFDLAFFGPNTFVGALYLAALEAAARMADLQGDHAFAKRCRSIAAKGSRWTVENLWNGEYFDQRIPAGASSNLQYGDGCLADQLFGQTWANQLDLGDLYPVQMIRTALQSVYRYNWAPNVATQNAAHPPQRWFARPGDAGLFTCTWPNGGRMAEPVLYRDEVWTGTEYQVASGLLNEGLIREGLSIIRGIDDRYDGRRHNPWNEVECGDHYSRAMASWGCLISLCGFVYDGPAGRIGFAPRWQQRNFKAFFSTAEGWGTLHQTRTRDSQANGLTVKYGSVRVTELAFEIPGWVRPAEAAIELEKQHIPSKATQMGNRVHIRLDEPLTVNAGQALIATMFSK